MVTTYFNKADIAYACAEIRANGEEPIIYASPENIGLFITTMPWADWDNDLVSEQAAQENKGFVGVFKGVYVYATNTVGDLLVIVPRYKENKKDE